MSIYIHNSHNVTVLLYHLVFPTKYRRIIINNKVDKNIRDICLEIQKRYEIHFVEIGTDKDHAHFLVQSVPIYTVAKLVTIIKSIIAKKILEIMPELKKELWGSNFWTSGYYASTIGSMVTNRLLRDMLKNKDVKMNTNKFTKTN